MIKNERRVSLQITPCGLRDAQAISDVAIRSYKDFYLHLWHDGGNWYINYSFSRPIIENELNDTNHAFFLVNDKEGPIGFLKLNIDKPLKGHELYNCIELERIYLIKVATGKGYGHQAMDFCFDYAKSLKKDIIWLKAMDTSDAVGFYESLGFRRCDSLTLSFPQMKEEFRGMVVLMKRL